MNIYIGNNGLLFEKGYNKEFGGVSEVSKDNHTGVWTTHVHSFLQ